MVETAPTGTEMPRRKRIPTPNFLSAHFRETEILFPLSHISVLSLWQVQSRRELINLALACDVAVCSLVSSSLHTHGKTEQILRTVPFCKDFLPYLFLTVAKEHWWVPFNLSVPTPLQQHLQAATRYLTPRTCHWKLSFPLECLGVLHSQTSYHHQLLLGYHHRGPAYPKNGTRPRWCTKDCEKYLKRGPCYPKAFIPATGKQRRRGIWGTSIWKIKEILAGSGIFQMGKVYNSKSLYSGIAWGTGLGTKTATVILDGQLLCVKKDTAVWIWCYRRRILNQ